jgi:hypothetical protein
VGVTDTTAHTEPQERWEPAGTRVLIMGLGLLGGGIGVARYFANHGADVRVTDLRSAEELRPTLEALSDIDAEYVLGEHREEDFGWADVIIRNPGVPPSSRWLRYAAELGKHVDMELSYVVERALARAARQRAAAGHLPGIGRDHSKHPVGRDDEAAAPARLNTRGGTRLPGSVEAALQRPGCVRPTSCVLFPLSTHGHEAMAQNVRSIVVPLRAARC